MLLSNLGQCITAVQTRSDPEKSGNISENVCSLGHLVLGFGTLSVQASTQSFLLQYPFC